MDLKSKDIFSKPVRQLENSWSVSVRQMWGLPLNTHKYFVEPLGGVHAHSMIISRFVNFLQSALKFKKLPVQFMLRRSLVNFNSITEKKMQATSNSWLVLNMILWIYQKIVEKQPEILWTWRKGKVESKTGKAKHSDVARSWKRK